MDKKIIWSPRSANNLDEICEYIARDSEYYAALVAKRILEIVESIPNFPEAGRVVPEYSDKTIRERFYKQYRIIYRVKSGAIEIVAITHGNKFLGDI